MVAVARHLQFVRNRCRPRWAGSSASRARAHLARLSFTSLVVSRRHVVWCGMCCVLCVCTVYGVGVVCELSVCDVRRCWLVVVCVCLEWWHRVSLSRSLALCRCDVSGVWASSVPGGGRSALAVCT